VTACSGGAQPTAHAGGQPRYGGTLRIVGDSDVDHLDTASAYAGNTYTVERAFARQLVTYPATGVHAMPTELVPDLAVSVPTLANGGVTDGGRTYTLHLRLGPEWDSSPPRPVTADDVVRGFKRLCNPVQPTGAPGYFESTIAGMAAYCTAFSRVAPTLAAVDDFIARHEIPGVRAVGRDTVVFRLVSPASDFVNILALPFSSPAPVEYLHYLPGSREQADHLISDGPYRITSYRPGVRMVLGRNPTWTQASDPVRHAYVDRIEVDEGVSADSVALQLQAGSADLQWEPRLPVAALTRLAQSHDPRLTIFRAGILNPYLVVNFQSPNAGRATSKLLVRQALEYAVDKAALVRAAGGTALNTTLDQLVTPGNVGYRPIDLYPTPGHRGDSQKARALLAAAGYAHGLTLKLLYPIDSATRVFAQMIQADLERAGISLQLLPDEQGAFYGRDVSTPSLARSGRWDLALTSWGADWAGNNGRTTLQPLLDGSTYGMGSVNFGDYDSARENALIARAVAAPTVTEAADLWHAADVQAMRDAAVVPLLAQQGTAFHSARVQHWRMDPVSWQGDVTALWLAR
jgi:peptide/nickel transport system substrate-binding protein